jgi:Domain of unknown function (DUF4159)
MSSPQRQRQLASALCLGVVLLLAGVAYAQRDFRAYPGLERDEAAAALPPDYQVPGEFVFGRLMYPLGGSMGMRGGNWKEGGTPWTIDYPLGDRNFARLLRRLTTIHVRSVEQPVDLDDGDDVFNWPFLYMDTPGAANLTDAQIAKLREYLLRGGFLLCDSFFGSGEWALFQESTLRRLFPDRPIVELADDHPIFHTVYDLTKRSQVRNMRSLRSRGVGYRTDGVDPHWSAVLDDEGRVMIAIMFNNDLGDAWQYADIPEYPQQDANLALRLGVNIAVYDLTH